MTQSTNPRDAWKHMAADAAAQQVEPNMRVGLGTGSTANFFIQALAHRHHRWAGDWPRAPEPAHQHGVVQVGGQAGGERDRGHGCQSFRQ